METGIYIFLLAILGSFILRTVGFGFGIFIMTMLPFLMPSFGEATCTSGLLAMSTSAYVVYKMRKHLRVRKLIVPLLAFVVVSSAAIFTMKGLDEWFLRMILAITLILASFYFILFSTKIRLRATFHAQVCIGALSGLMGGFFGMQGPPAVLYFLQSEPDKEHYMALIQAYLLVSNIMMLLVRAYNGFLTAAVGWAFLWGIGGVAIGTALGTMAFRHIPQHAFRYVVYAYIGVSGIWILLSL